MMGTDAGAVWFLLAAALVVVPAAALLARRWIPEVRDMSHQTFSCFGSRCGLWVTGDGAAEAVDDARRCLENWHVRFSRFIASSELSRLNADPREVVPVSTTMTQLLRAVREAAEATGGLVDGTLAREIEAAGYRSDLAAPLPLDARAAARPAAPAGDAPRPWREFARRRLGGHAPARARVRQRRARQGPVRRPDRRAARGLRELRRRLRRRRPLRRPRARRRGRRPFGGAPLHRFRLRAAASPRAASAGAAGSAPDGRPAHHLLDPATGRPAFTGVVQATALAPTAVEAEWRAKAAVLSGPEAARDWLPHGGVVVLDDGSHFTNQGDTTMIKSRIAVARISGRAHRRSDRRLRL